jgi:hypothetical protein
LVSDRLPFLCAPQLQQITLVSTATCRLWFYSSLQRWEDFLWIFYTRS